MAPERVRRNGESPEQRRARKIAELSEEHGSIVKRLIAGGRLPQNQLDNFYGRHADRRNAILAAMRNGAAYSTAYRQSSDCFDTKRWGKVANRTAACRGHLLKTTASLVAKGLPVKWDRGEIDRIDELANAFARTAEELIRKLAVHELEAMPKPLPKSTTSAKRKSTGSEPCDISTRPPTFKQVESQFGTAITKLKKNIRDVPFMFEKVGSLPTVDDVARTVVEAARIINGVPLLLAALRSEARSDGRRGNGDDPWGIGTAYAVWLDGKLQLAPPTKRIATHKEPDADALVATWIAERFLFSGTACRVEFVAREYSVPAKYPFDAVLDVGRLHDTDRLIFDHKPSAFSNRDLNCATSLVWRHLLSAGRRVDHLRELVELVHDGDAASYRFHDEVACVTDRSFVMIAIARPSMTPFPVSSPPRTSRVGHGVRREKARANECRSSKREFGIFWRSLTSSGRVVRQVVATGQ